MDFDLYFRLKCLWAKHILVPYRFWKLRMYGLPEDEFDYIFLQDALALCAMTLFEAENYQRELAYWRKQVHNRDVETDSPKLIEPEDRLALPDEIQKLANFWNDGQTP